MTPFDSYKLFMSLKTHFGSSTYDYFQYGIMNRLKQSAFEQKKIKYAFHRLIRKHSDESLERYFASNLFNNSKFWVYDFDSEESNDIHNSFERYMLQHKHLFEKDLNNINLKSYTLNQLFSQGILIDLVEEEEISWYTICILNNLVPFIDGLDRDPIIWSDSKLAIIKFTPFLGNTDWAAPLVLTLNK